MKRTGSEYNFNVATRRVWKKLFFGCFCFFLFFRSIAENNDHKVAFDLDSTYIDTYYNDLIVRVLSANSNNFIRFCDTSNNYFDLKYRLNDYFNIGIGINYKWFGINIGTKIPLLSSNNDLYGKSSKFGIQSYLYARKFTFDVMAIKNRGYYLSHDDNDLEEEMSPDNYYKRRDIKTYNFAFDLNYVVNNKKFSYKAAFKQNELQKKSAGSMLLGGAIYYLSANADSSFIPSSTDQTYFQGWRTLNGLKCYSINASVGYAYSLVPLKNWIATGSYRLSLGLQRSIWNFEEADTEHQVKLNQSGVLRLSAGYHFPWFYVGFSYVRYQQNPLPEKNSLQVLNGTNYTEITLSRRIRLKKH